MNKFLGLIPLVLAPAVLADEGMWTYDNFPKTQVQAKYGFTPTDAWLQKARLASVRLAEGCSGSFVSGQGLVMTNHHCAHSCIEQNSTAQHDYIQRGFFAPAPKDELKCPEIEVDQLTAIQDVTRQVDAATRGLEGAARNTALTSITASLTHRCQTSPSLRCDLVALYHGGIYQLHTYRRFQDVRLAFAPEFAAAFFGGDPDNFNFPRYDLDVTFLRVYDQGKPASTPNHFGWSSAGAKEGDLTFVSGHPWTTQRELTVAELEMERDVVLPERAVGLAQLRGMLGEYQLRGPEQARHSTSTLFYVDNSFKVIKGRGETLRDPDFFAAQVAKEKAFRARVAQDATLQKKYGDAWDAIQKALLIQRQLFRKQLYLNKVGLASHLFSLARTLSEGTTELQKPNEQRYREYADAELPEVQQTLFSSAPVYPEFEVEMLALGLTRMREDLGADDPIVRRTLGKESPRQLAERVIHGTRLADPQVRKALWEGGASAVARAQDPLLDLVRRMDPDAREVRRRFETQVEPVLAKNTERIARAHFELEGTASYPDATQTLRLSFGQVRGYTQGGQNVTPVTTFGGAFERATGQEPFALPESWLRHRADVKASTPFDMATTNDIIGGNSGSPVFNKNLEVVGLIFDGNIQSLGGNFGYDPSVNRAVSVESVAIIEALRHIYGAQHLAEEITKH